MVDAVLASLAIPGLFSPVQISGTLLMDGSVADNVPVSTALRAGATEVFVLNAGYACALAAPPSTALGMALHAITLLLHRDHPTQVSVPGARLHVVPPLCPQEVSPADFKHAAELIDRALISTDAWLRAGQPGLDHHHDQTLAAR